MVLLRLRQGSPILAFVLASGLSGCGARTPQLTPFSTNAVILAFGDSLTYGTGAPSDQSYPEILEKMIHRRVINSGVPGEVTAQGLTRLPQVLDSVRPALLIICHGGNDILRRYDHARTKRNILAMIALARERNIPIVLVGVPKPGIRISTADMFYEIADEAAVPFEGSIMAEIISSGHLKSDAVHPNAAGYEAMAGAIHAMLRKAGAV